MSVTVLLNSYNANIANPELTSLSWELDFRNLIGSPLYDKFTHFKLKLSSVIILTGSNTDSNNNLSVHCSGLNFFGSSGTACLGLIKAGTAVFSSLYVNTSDSSHCFFKPDMQSSFNIQLKTVSANSLSTTNLGNSAFLFTIEGINL